MIQSNTAGVVSIRTLIGGTVGGCLLACAAQGAGVTRTPVTNTTPNFAGTIVVTGTVTMGAGEIMYNPAVMSGHAMSFLSTYTAGFNGPGQQFDPVFLAWNGVGTYSGPIVNHLVHPGNLGYSSGMPLGLYGTNALGPAGGSGITLHWYTQARPGGSMAANYAIQVVPASGAAVALALGSILAGRRRRRGRRTR